MRVTYLLYKCPLVIIYIMLLYILYIFSMRIFSTIQMSACYNIYYIYLVCVSHIEKYKYNSTQTYV